MEQQIMKTGNKPTGRTASVPEKILQATHVILWRAVEVMRGLLRHIAQVVLAADFEPPTVAGRHHKRALWAANGAALWGTGSQAKSYVSSACGEAGTRFGRANVGRTSCQTSMTVLGAT
jgi:hypothetical protein